MRFPPTFLDEIKARLPVSEVVRRRVKLQKAGREWKGLSPFSAEKTPSFFVNDQKQAWFDFSSGQNGNVFDFVMRTEGLSFPDAVERLAADAGLSLPEVSPETARREKARASLQDVLELAARFFEEQLQAPIGARARGYLADRGLSPQIQRQFRLGYAPSERFALREYLAAKGAGVDQLIETGMLIHGEDIPVPYDRFRNRVMFPIADRSGKVIAFGGRALEKDVPAKYLNSPETTLFHKGAMLYNHHNARKAAHDRGAVIAVEGYVDVIAMSAAGFPHVVAPMGTALTPDQCDLMWRMAEEPILCFDGDKAGRKAADRAVDTALPLIGPGRSLRFAFLPEGQDPDDLARSGGAAAIEEVLSAARPLIDVLWTRELQAGPLDTPERRAALERRLREVVRGIADETLRRHYWQALEERLAGLFGVAPQAQGRGSAGAPRRPYGGRATQPMGRAGFRRDEPRAGFASTPVPPSQSLANSALLSRGRVSFPPREALIVLLLLNHPRLAVRFVEEIASLEFVGGELASLRDSILSRLSVDPEPDRFDLRAAVDRAGHESARRRVEAMELIASQKCIRPEASESDAEEVLRQALALHHRSRALHKDLKSAELALAQDASDETLARLRDIQGELASIEGREAVVEGFGISSGLPREEV
jgi:DNA primase